MKKLITILMVSMLCIVTSFAQPCANYFELCIDPCITERTGAGKVLKAEFKITLKNVSADPNGAGSMAIWSQQYGIGVSAALTSLTGHGGVADQMNIGSGGFVNSSTQALNQTVNGVTYTDWLQWGITVNGATGFEPHVIPVGGSDCVATITLDFDGTQDFTDSLINATASRPFIGDKDYICFFPGDGVLPIALVLNDFGTRIVPPGIPVALPCYSTIMGFKGPGPLAVDLFEFYGKKQEEGNVLNWSVLNEINVKEHVVQRRTERMEEFVDIHQEAGVNNEHALNQYQHLDRGMNQNAYYRIKSIEEDGEISYSHIIFLERNERKMTVYPNPSFGDLNIEYTSTNEEDIQLKIVDKAGRVQWLQQRDVVEGFNNLKLDISELPAGMYYLELSSSNIQLQERIIKK